MKAKTNKKVAVQGGSDQKMGEIAVVAAKPTSIPNPVKGLRLSLYPMTKQH